MRSSVVITGIVLLLIAGGLMATDLVLKELPAEREVAQENMASSNTVASSTMSSSVMSGNTSSEMMAMSSSEATAISSSVSSGPRVVKKGTSTKKSAGVNVQEVFGTLQLSPTPSGEAGFLFFLAKDRSKVQTYVLLKNNDRAFLFSWIEEDDVKVIFNSLKQALSEQFSGKLEDLIDETQYPDNGPPRDVLSFFDPALSPEKITFLRIKNRLYEIHTSKNAETLLPALIDALSQ